MTKPFTLVLLRHGQSTWNLENLFTGWHDVPLSSHGVEEALEAGRLMKEAGLSPDVVHTSVLVRAIETSDLALAEMGLTWIPVRRSWRLNERHYGDLQGKNKAETAKEFGEALEKAMRNDPLAYFDSSKIKPRLERAASSLGYRKDVVRTVSDSNGRPMFEMVRFVKEQGT